VVVLTASDSPSDRETATRNAAPHYFRKPSTLEQYMQLGDVVKSIIALKAAARTEFAS
jgi:CheY-like chemotaxis protein